MNSATVILIFVGSYWSCNIVSSFDC